MTRNRLALTMSLLGTLLLAATPWSANAGPNCTQMDLYGRFLRQSNNWRTTLESPTAADSCIATCDDPGNVLRGTVTIDSMTPDNIKFVIAWDNGSAGIYTGAMDADGFVSGITRDRWHPESKADWHYEGANFPCY